MYHVNKVVGWLLSPLGAFFLGLAAAGLLRALAARRAAAGRAGGAALARAAKWTAGLALAFLWVASCPVLTYVIGPGLEREWERPGAPHGDISALPRADAIVVLGGGAGFHRACGAQELFSGADRLWQGARLYKAGLAPVVAVSCPENESGADPFLMDLGVPADAVVGVSEARNTEEEARILRDALARAVPGAGRAPKILLVTSAWHMGRARLLFARAGFDVTPAPADFEMSSVREQPLGLSAFLPNADALLRNSAAIKEWIATFGYRWLRRAG